MSVSIMTVPPVTISDWKPLHRNTLVGFSPRTCRPE